MDYNMRNVGMNPTFQKKLKEYENEVARMKTALKKALTSMSKADRVELLSGGRVSCYFCFPQLFILLG
jgi:hypothetical protein